MKEPETKNRGQAADAGFDPKIEGLMRIAIRVIEYQIFHASVGELLSGLAREHHQYDPFDLLQIELLGVQGEQSVDDDLALAG